MEHLDSYGLLNLKVAKDRKGMAPNKPLLVLAILDLVEAGLVGADGVIHKDAQLNLRFRSYSPICASRRWPNTGSGRYSSGADTKRVDNVRIWYQAGSATARPLGLA